MTIEIYALLVLFISIISFIFILYFFSKIEEKNIKKEKSDLPSDDRIDENHLSKLDKIVHKKRRDIRKHIFLGNSIKSNKDELYDKLNNLLDIEIKSRYYSSSDRMVLLAFVVKEDYHHEKAIEITICKLKKNEELSYRVYQQEADEDGVEISLSTTLFFNQKEIDIIFTIIRDRYYTILDELKIISDKKYKEELDLLNNERKKFNLTNILE